MSTLYADRAAEHSRLRDVELDRSRVMARWRLTIFLPAAALFLWSLSRSGHPLGAVVSLALFLVFGLLVVRHARIDERAAWHDAVVTVNKRAIARLERRWDALGAADGPPGISIDGHPYAFDLDLFGRASLYQWVGPAATVAGASRLASWLLAPAPPDEVSARQAAIAELAPLTDFRERVAAHGVLAGGAAEPGVTTFLSWCEEPTTGSSWLRPAVLLMIASIWTLGALQLFGVLDGAYWLVPLTLGLVLSFGLAGRVHRTFDRAGAGQRTLGRYAELLADAAEPRFEAPWLRAVQERLSAEGAAAPQCMRRLARILGFAELRSGAAILHFPVQALTLWDFHVFFAIERWRRGTGHRVRGWLEALADLDAAVSLAGIKHDHPSWVFPSITEEPIYRARGLGHPLLPNDRRVTNDVEIGPPGTVVLVTGSNMSGKSTLLRAVGLNAVLAQAGSCVCAEAVSMPPCDLQTSIRVQDSLELGLSYFMAALARLKGVVDAAERPAQPGRRLLYLLDEILQGTNSIERALAVRAVAQHLLDAGAIGMMTTHDLNLAQEEPLRSAARLVHFTETVDEQGAMRFDYKLREGLATSRNALRLMELIGIRLTPPAPRG